jgi:hypothetical protein
MRIYRVKVKILSAAKETNSSSCPESLGIELRDQKDSFTD